MKREINFLYQTRLRLYVLIVISLLFQAHFSPAQAQTNKKGSSKTKLSQSVKSSDESYAAILKKYKIDPNHVSLQLVNEDNQEIFSLNPRQKKIPASITKVITAFAVAKKLTAGHRFYTKIYSDGQNLYLQGGGDPSFVSENMWYLVNEFLRSDIKQVRGNIIVDDTLFDRIRFDSSRTDKRVDRAYDAPVGAMSFNWNAVNIFIRPEKAGEKARVIVDPESEYFDLVNNTVTVATTPKKELDVLISNTEKLITVSGEIKENSPERAIFKSVAEPEIWSGINLMSFLAQRDVQVQGRVIAGRVPSNAELVAVYESKNLAHILADMNKFSNNFVAEMLTKNLAATEIRSGVTLSRGVEILREELRKAGVETDAFTVVNPSGLTRENLISAATFNKILQNIKKDFSIYSTILESLPIAGVDGTLKRRMKNSTAESWVRAKTGYLDGVVTLAGYAGHRDGRVFSFSFLYNGPRDEAQVREAFDQIIINSLN